MGRHLGKRRLKTHQRRGAFQLRHKKIEALPPQEDHNYAAHDPLAPQNEVKEVKWQRRLTKDEFSRVVKAGPTGLYGVPDADGQSGGAKILRPKPNPPSLCEQHLQPNENTGEMRLVNSTLNLAMFNQCKGCTRHVDGKIICTRC